MKTKKLFYCSNCDAQYQKWIGRCLECGKWSSIEQKKINKKTIEEDIAEAGETYSLDQIKGQNISRNQTGISELDRVLGGGIVPGSLILLGGEPGIGKSTLSIQIAASVKNTLYVSGEESVGQIKLRADRILGNQTNTTKLSNQTQIETIAATIKKEKPEFVVIDSIQTVHSEEVAGESGSPNQIRACTAKLMEIAKKTNTSVCIIGHVTKDGSVAGPKTLEHLVDTVLYLEGDRHHGFRILRTVKNRFGATDEVGIFDMKENGLVPVSNPSELFLSERTENIPGSVVTCLMEGTRPLLVEIQALVNKTSFGYPVRKASGFDLNRLHVLVAVLEKRAGLGLSQYDIHLNVVSGMKANEPAADLAVCLAIASSFKDKALGKDLVVFGEVGLGGEVRSVLQSEKRIREAGQLGMKRVITASNKSLKQTAGLQIIPVKNISELVRYS